MRKILGISIVLAFVAAALSEEAEEAGKGNEKTKSTTKKSAAVENVTSTELLNPSETGYIGAVGGGGGHRLKSGNYGHQDQAFVVTSGYKVAGKVADGVLDGSFGGVTHGVGGVRYGYDHEGPHHGQQAHKTYDQGYGRLVNSGHHPSIHHAPHGGLRGFRHGDHREFGYGSVGHGISYSHAPTGHGGYRHAPIGHGGYRHAPIGHGGYSHAPAGHGGYRYAPAGQGGYRHAPIGHGSYRHAPSGVFGHGIGGHGGYNHAPTGHGGFGHGLGHELRGQVNHGYSGVDGQGFKEFSPGHRPHGNPAGLEEDAGFIHGLNSGTSSYSYSNFG